MEWLMPVGMVGSVLASIYYMHNEHMKEIRERNQEFKDFHGRMCALEQKYVNMMERTLERKR